MKLPKLPANMQEAKEMVHDLYEQVVDKVTEVCNKMGKPAEQPPVNSTAEPKKPETKKDSENPPA